MTVATSVVSLPSLTHHPPPHLMPFQYALLAHVHVILHQLHHHALGAPLYTAWGQHWEGPKADGPSYTWQRHRQCL